MSWDGDPNFKECHEEGKVSTCLETPHKLCWGSDGGALYPQKGTRQQVLRRQNRETSPQRSFPTNPSQLRSCLHTSWGKWGLGAEAQASKIGPQKEDQHWLLWKYSEDTAERSREMLGLPRQAKDHCCQDPLTPHACLLQAPNFMSVNTWDKSWLWTATPDVYKPNLAWVPEADYP